MIYYIKMNIITNSIVLNTRLKTNYKINPIKGNKIIFLKLINLIVHKIEINGIHQNLYSILFRIDKHPTSIVYFSFFLSLSSSQIFRFIDWKFTTDSNMYLR